MTMVPTQTPSKHPQQQEKHQLHILHPFFYCGCGGGNNNYSYNNNNNNIGLMSSLEGYDYFVSSEACIGRGSKTKSNPMAEEDSGNTSLNEAAGSSSQQDRDEGWLQLSIGRSSHDLKTDHLHQEDPTVGRRPSREFLELNLLQGGGSTSQQARSPPNINLHVDPPRPVLTMAGPSCTFPSPLLLQQQHGSSSSTYFPPPPPPPPPPPHHHQGINWAYRPLLHNIAATPPAPSSSSGSPSSSTFIPLGTYFSRPVQLHGRRVDVPISISADFRVIDPPRRPLSSIWFMLQAASNQAKEPFLPQISKSFLRIKDGRMTVRLLMKYLVNKLQLDSESELEITCRGQQLLPFLTLQHVRDNIWSPRDVVTLLPDSSTADHIMALHYGRRA